MNGLPMISESDNTPSFFRDLDQYLFNHIQAILRHKSVGTTERYLKSLGLEETREHLEALCDMRKSVEQGNEAVKEVTNGKLAAVISLIDRLEKRPQAV